MRFELVFCHDMWSASQRRDFIDSFQSFVQKENTRVLAELIRNNPHEKRAQLDAVPWERFFRVSFPWVGEERVKIDLCPVTPPELKEIFLAEATDVHNQVSSGKLMRFVDWLGVKFLGKEDFEKTDQAMSRKYITKNTEDALENWNINVFSLFAEKLQEFFVSQGLHSGVFTLHTKDGSGRMNWESMISTTPTPEELGRKPKL